MRELSSYTSSFDFRPILLSLLIGIIIYLGFKFIYRFAIPILLRDKRNNNSEKWISITESICWGIYVIFTIFSIIKPNPILGSFLVVVILSVSWSFLRDYIAGLIILLANHFKIGQKVRFNEYEGTILKMYKLSLEIELNNGEKLLLPYHLFNNQPIIKTSPSDKVMSSTLNIKLPTKRGSINELREVIYNKIISLPWSVPSIPPKIEFVDETLEDYLFKVVLHGIDKKHLLQMEQQLKKELY